MTSITITRFHQTRTGYSREDQYVASVSPCPGLVSAEQHLRGLVQQLNRFEGEATGWHFGRWKGQTNDGANVVENHAITLSWPATAGVADQLEARLAGLGWAHLVITSENRKSSRNLITIAFPLAQPITDKAKYARIASVLAYQIAIGNMEPTLTAHTYITHAHRQTEVAMVEGPLLDPQAFITATKDYAAPHAHRWHGYQPTRAAHVHVEPPVWTQDDAGLFAWPVSAAEQKQLDADALLASIGVTLR